jgi:hypothetical protein
MVVEDKDPASEIDLESQIKKLEYQQKQKA